MTTIDWAARLFVQAKNNFLLVDVTHPHFAKEAAKNDAGELMRRRFELFELGDPERGESYWNEVISHLNSLDVEDLNAKNKQPI